MRRSILVIAVAVGSVVLTFGAEVPLRPSRERIPSPPRSSLSHVQKGSIAIAMPTPRIEVVPFRSTLDALVRRDRDLMGSPYETRWPPPPATDQPWDEVPEEFVLPESEEPQPAK